MYAKQETRNEAIREKCPGGVLLEGGLFLEEVQYVETEIGVHV